MDMAVVPTFRRELLEFVSVEVDGAYEVDPDITDRLPGRVLITMPDFTAEALAHVLSHLDRIAGLLDAERVGISPGELAQALHDAAATTGAWCSDESLE